MAKSNLVIRLSALGDVALLVAVLREAAERYPDRHYTLVSRPRMQALLSGLPQNVHFLPYGQPVRWSEYDRVLDMHSVWRSLGLDIRALLHGLPVRRLRKPRFRQWLLCHGHDVRIESKVNQYRHLLDLPPVAIPAPVSNGREGIGIAPFAAFPGKIYPLEKMEEVVRQLSQSGEPICLFGGGDKEKAILQAWQERYPNVTSLVGTMTMEEELAVMARLRVMLCMDSGNMHLASLVGTRVVSIWGATHPAAGFLGYGQSETDCLQADLPCRPCSIYGKKACTKADPYRCMHAISPQTIVQHLL